MRPLLPRLFGRCATALFTALNAACMCPARSKKVFDAEATLRLYGQFLGSVYQDPPPKPHATGAAEPVVAVPDGEEAAAVVEDEKDL